LSLGVLLVLTTACRDPGESQGDDEGTSGPTGGNDDALPMATDSTDGPLDDDDEETSNGDDTGDINCGLEETYIEGLLDERCGGCHGPAADPPRVDGYTYVNDIQQLVGTGKIVIGDAEGSRLYQRIENGSMPLEGEPLSQADVGRIRTFIESCEVAPVPPPANCAPNPFLSEDDVIGAMRADIQGEVEREEDREFTRYLSCAHLSNQGVCGEDLDRYRDSVNKLLNSTSVEARITPVTVVEGTYGSVFRINLEDYGYDRPVVADAFNKIIDLDNDAVAFELAEDVQFNDKWELASRGSAYGYPCDLADDDCGDLVDEAQDFIPYMLCDAFIEIASRTDDSDFVSGVYYDMIEAPADLVGLEALLNFSFDDELAAEEVVRAGVTTSNATRNEVLVQWLQAQAGEDVWTRCDFDGNEVGEDLRNNPLDILNECDNQAIMYNLPNDLFAFFMVDENEIRIDAIDSNDFGDPRLAFDKGGDNIALLSCHGCHGGTIMRPAVDSVRAIYDAGDGNVAINEQDVRDIYPELDAFQGVLDDSEDKYLVALGNAEVQPDRDTIQTHYLGFRGEVLPLRAASELALSENQFEGVIGDCNDALAGLGSGQDVTRDRWESFYLACACDAGIVEPDFCAGVLGGVDDVAVDEANFAAIFDAAAE